MERGFAELIQPIFQTVEICCVKPDERVVILSDTNTVPVVTDAFFTAVTSVGADPVLVTMTVRPQMLMNPPDSAVAAMMDADVVFDLTVKPWLYTEATNRILDSGTRMLQVGFATQETLIHRPPTHQIIEREKATKNLLEGCKTFHVFSEDGTDIVMERGDRRIHTQGGAVDHPGDWDSYGVCLAAFAPLEDRANGKVFLNGTLDINPHEIILAQPIEIDVESGRLVNIKVDHPEAKQLADWLEAWDDPNAYIIAHTGFGLDHRAKLQPPDRSAWESILGGVNIAFGANNIPQLGGRTSSKSHLDAVLLNVSVEVDGRLFVEKGKLVGIDNLDLNN